VISNFNRNLFVSQLCLYLNVFIYLIIFHSIINKDDRIKSLSQLHSDYTFEFDAFPKPLNIKIDRYQFEQMLIIFIDNAMKYDQINKYIQIQTKLRNV
jgi:signal transduction histidine kinase